MARSQSATYDASAMAATATLASKAVTVTPGGEAVTEVRPFTNMSAELIPRTPRGSSRARAQLALDNRGNVRVNARLTAADPDRKLNFTITPPAITAEAGTASFATVRLSPRQRHLTGP